MTDTNLPWTVLGKQIKPFSFALSFTMIQLAWSVLSGSTIGVALDQAGPLVGTVAALSFVLLTMGFWIQSNKIMRWGLLLATGSWASAAAILWLDVGLTPSTLSASCWVLAAGGAWLLEASDPHGTGA